MAQFDFDKGIPIPTTTVRHGVNIETLRAMQPGQSKWWPADEQKKATRFYRVAKRLGVPIIVRKVGEDDPRGVGVRMWRVTSKGDSDPIAAAAANAGRKAPAKQAAKKGAAKKKAPAKKIKPPKTTKKAAKKKAAKVKVDRTPRRRASDKIMSNADVDGASAQLSD